MEKTVNEVLNLAREYMLVSENKIKIIKHCRKTLLYYNEVLWIKKELVVISITLYGLMMWSRYVS